MISPMYLAVMVLMVVYCKTDALQPKDVEPHRCYQCSDASCAAGPPPVATCPPERPLCATAAQAPNYKSSLTCAAGGESPCSLTHSSNQELELICVCKTDLCNAPFSSDLQNELITFASSDFPNNQTDYIAMFWKQSHLVNDNDSHVYKKITMKISNATELPITNDSEMSMGTNEPVRAQTQAGHYAGQYGRQYAGMRTAPRAEMLRQETAAPSDDEEDESEGSGTDEDHLAPRPSTTFAPTAASPTPTAADDDDVIRPFIALIASLPAFFYLLV